MMTDGGTVIGGRGETISTAPLQRCEQVRFAVALRRVALADRPVIFVQGEQGAIYYIVVSSASAGPTSGPVTVTENPPTGESIISMAGGSVWTCGASSCATSKSIAAGTSYPPIAVSVMVASNAASPLTNIATVSGGGSALSPSASDLTTVVPLTCTFTGGPTATVADVQMLIDEALGLYPAAFDLNGDGSVNVADIQTVVGAATSGTCVL